MGTLTQPFLKYYISKEAQFYVCCNYSVPCSANSAVVLTYATVVLTYAANAALDRSGICDPGELESTPRSLLSMVTTHCDAENQVFLATHCDRLRGPFISPHFLSVNGSSSITPEETI